LGFSLSLFIDLIIIFILILAIKQFQKPESARRGNFMAALALMAAMLSVALRNSILRPEIVILALAAGGVAGWGIAMKVSMIQIPAMVAFQHGAGGVAAFLVSFVELTRNANAEISPEKMSGVLGLIIGAATFSGSMVASAKLANIIRQTPWSFARPGRWMGAAGVFTVFFPGLAGFSDGFALAAYLMVLIALSSLVGLVFSLRIGGADMPVLISFLNATAGLAAAFCGVIIQNRLLVACGATVAASGSILTHVMCRAMNRNLMEVLAGVRRVRRSNDMETKIPAPAEKGEEICAAAGNCEPPPGAVSFTDPFPRAIEACREAKKIIVVPGYGMALAQAQFKVAGLANLFERGGKQVKFAIHPVAGRMPGHMNVLLAEADVSYDKLSAMDEINEEFRETDLALVVGACDVVNPAAIRIEGTPISGMPILVVHEAKKVIVLNLDEKPGYSGVDNPLYKEDKTILLLGDAKDNLDRLEKAFGPEGTD